MRTLKHESLWVGVIYFLILLSIALWVRDIPNQPDAFNTTLQQISEGTAGRDMGDPASFAKGAIDIAENGRISGANEWIFNLWPPGFMLLDASIIKALGPEAPVILVLQILAALLFSIVLVLLYDFLGARVKSKVAFTLPLLIFAFPVSRVFLLQPQGIVLGESFAIGFFLIGILLALRALARNSLRYAVYAGICLALAAYFRSQFEFILLVLSGWGIFLVIVVQLIRLRKSIDPKLLKSAVKTIVVVLLVAHAATIPWRAYRWMYFYQGSPSWVTTNDLYYGNSVMTSEHLLSLKGDWLVDGGANLVCRIDPSTCGDTANAKKLFFRTFITHPVEWYSLKFDVIGKYWFSSLRNWAPVTQKSSFMDIVTNGVLLIAMIALVPLLFARKVRSHSSWLLLMWFVPSLFSAYLLIFTFAPLEVRYFYFLKISGIAMLLIITGLYCRSAKNIAIDNNQSKQVLFEEHPSNPLTKELKAMNDSAPLRISLVIPVYRGEKTLPILIEEITPLTFGKLTPSGISYVVCEVILVHDCGPDRSDMVLEALGAKYSFVRPVWLSRNYGQHAATMAGMASATGDWVATIDEDGQQDPADIGRMLDSAIGASLQLVYAQPTNPPPHGWLRNTLSRTAKAITTKLLGNSQIGKFNSFRLVDGEIARTLAAYCGNGVYLDIGLFWIVGRIGHCRVPLRNKLDRPSGYSYFKLFNHFWNLILTTGTRPLRLITLMGFCSLVIAIIISGYAVYGKYFSNTPVQGWASLLIIVSFFSGATLTSLGVIAEYLAVTMGIAMGKPLYVVGTKPTRPEIHQ
jgi:undecaprenyl-phosphate 4-deoxy-4-formamido-L-arabinose transferase